MRIGLIADTHGYLDPRVPGLFRDCAHILHAGDVGDGVLGPLRELAPVAAVAGNNDLRGEASTLPALVELELGGRRVCLVHRLVDAPAGDHDLLVFGHCHRPHDEHDGRRRLLNPGAAGRRGFHRERSVAYLDLACDPPVFTLVSLGPRGARP